MDCKGCKEGITMCEQRPCWGTPEDIAKIKAAGFGHRLWLDYWEEDDKLPFTLMLSPATKGSEGGKAPLYPMGQCTFLLPDKRCELHDLGLKPMEGREACCKVDDQRNLHFEVAASWVDHQDEAHL